MARSSGPIDRGRGVSAPRPLRHGRGFQLVQLVVALAIVGSTAAVAIPPVLRWSSALRVRMAAAEFVGVLRKARILAVSTRSNVGVKFWPVEQGRVAFALHRDGDGDGVRTADIRSGVDPAIGPPMQLQHVGAHVRLGFPPGPAPRDPARPSRRLDRLDDPIRFNRSDIASFNPFGESTPGSLYLTDGVRALAVVRLFGGTGKVKVLVYDPARESWHPD